MSSRRRWVYVAVSAFIWGMVAGWVLHASDLVTLLGGLAIGAMIIWNTRP